MFTEQKTTTRVGENLKAINSSQQHWCCFILLWVTPDDFTCSGETSWWGRVIPQPSQFKSFPEESVQHYLLQIMADSFTCQGNKSLWKRVKHLTNILQDLDYAISCITSNLAPKYCITQSACQVAELICNGHVQP